MLAALSVRDVVLIEALDLELGPGFTALTGETGAGKSILLDALGLALGARADKGLVRAGAERASAAAAFEVGADHPAHALIAEMELPEAEDGRIVLRRTLGADGKGRAFVNDAPASAGALRAIGASLLEICGQHAALGLTDPGEHRRLLDAFAGAQVELAAVANAWDDLVAAGAALEAIAERAARAARDRDWLIDMLGELDRLDPRPGEEERLDGERRFLMGSERLAAALADAQGALSDSRSGSVETRLTNAARALGRLGDPGPDHAALGQAVAAAAAALDRALVEVGEARAGVEAAIRAFDAEPQKLEQVEERLFALRAAARKHGVGADALPDLRARARADLASIDTADAERAAAEQALKAAQAAFETAAGVLSSARQAAAKHLEAVVAAELPALKLERARFRALVAPGGAKPGPHGTDKVGFEIAANPGAPFGPLADVASGGELSRLTLALKVALSRSAAMATLIFDEIDQGVGGATADAVGRRLRALAGSTQILCVTHSPQVAARADAHWRIEKAAAGGAMRTKVVALDDAAREEELARMLAGAAVTDEARAAARALVGAD
jgi:DNA repair protein RecN (Recombination protein N)